MAALGIKLVGGSGFWLAAGSIRDIRPAKKRGHAVVYAVWGKRHKRTSGGKAEVRPMICLGEAKQLKAKWQALLAATGGRQ